MKHGAETPAPKADSWALATLALRVNRIDLIIKTNLATGAPSYNVAKMQHEFIAGLMGPEEVVAFGRLCLRLVDAAPKPHE